MKTIPYYKCQNNIDNEATLPLARILEPNFVKPETTKPHPSRKQTRLTRLHTSPIPPHWLRGRVPA